MNNSKQEQKLNHLPDAQLVAVFQAREGEHTAAYAELVRRHRPDLFRRCRARLGNPMDADEAAQESLLRAFRGLPGFRGDSCFRTWLFSIADNQCNSLYVRRSRHVLSDHVRAIIELQQEMRGSDRNDDADDLVQQVREVLAALPSQASEVLMLRFHGELALDDIAATLGIGLSATKMRLYRAIAQFEQRYLATYRQAI